MHGQGLRRPDSRMEFTPCPVFHQPQQPRLHQDFFVQHQQQQQQDYHYQTMQMQYCLTTQQQFNFVEQQQHHPPVAVYQQQPSPLQALSGVATSVDSPGQSSVDSGYCATSNPSAASLLQTPAYYTSSDVVLGAPSSTSLKGTAVGGSGGEGPLSKQLQHRNSQHSQSANNPQGEKQPQEDDLDRLLEMEMATAVGSENSSSAVR